MMRVAWNPYCGMCAQIGLETLGYADLDSFSEAHKCDAQVRAKVETCRRNRDSSHDIKREHVEFLEGQQMRIEREFRALSEADFRHEFKVGRITKRMVEHVPVIVVPCETDLSKSESLYCV